jgi:ribosomal protein S18 acetylase RimI-like enzyme
MLRLMTDIRTATQADTPAVMDTVTLAFARDPVVRYWWPQPSEFLRWWPKFALAMGERGFDAGSVDVAGDFEAVAMWLPPGVETDPEAIEALDMPSSEEGDEIMGELRGEMARYHPETPHWYLWAIAADPSLQGKGLGSSLLKHRLAAIDARGETAYLESSAPYNVPLYERHGFEVMGVIQVRDVPPITPMIRLPR